MTGPAIACAILAGGRSSRMEGGNKVFMPLAGRPLIQHVIDRIGPQVEVLALSVESWLAELEVFGLMQLPDPAPGHHGPLCGLLAALRYFHVSQEWLLIVPCDAPLLPTDLAGTLQARATAAAAPSAAVFYAGELQPTFSIWHRSLLPVLEVAVGRDGLSGFKQFMRTIEVAESHWPVGHPPPFFNINDRTALDRASRWVQPGRETSQACSA